ncbi:MAG: glycerol acyltransferase, partial [Bacteroidetes bacterium]
MIFSFLYDFFNKHKFLLYLFISILFGSSIYIVSQVKLEEDITKLIPHNEKIVDFNSTFKKIKFLDKIVVNVFFTDSTKSNADSLIDFTNYLTDTLSKTIKGNLADDIVYKVSSENILESYNIIYNNLPLFLTDTDYSKIKTLLIDSNIQKTITNDYKSLISPTSIALKKFILKDPLSLTAIVLKKLQTLQVDKNFNLQNGYVVSKNNKNLLFFIIPKFSGTETNSNGKLVSEIKKIITATEQKYNGKINAEFFGAPVVAVGNAIRIKKDIYLTVTIAMTLLLVLLTYFFRNKLIILIILLPVFFGALIGLASLVIFKSSISAVSLGVGSVLLGISIDYALHLITHLRDAKNKNTTLKDISLPLLMSSVTTAIAFLCLFFVHSDALHDLALFSSISVVASAIITLILLPHLVKNIDKTKT